MQLKIDTNILPFTIWFLHVECGPLTIALFLYLQTWEKLKVFFYAAYSVLIAMFLAILLDPTVHQDNDSSDDERGTSIGDDSLDLKLRS